MCDEILKPICTKRKLQNESGIVQNEINLLFITSQTMQK